MKKSRIVALILTLAVTGAGATYFVLKTRNKKQTAWRYAVAEKGDVEALVTATGSLSPLTIVQVGTQVSGTIARLFADYNSVVRAGQIIALLDTTFLAASLNEARAALERAQIQFRQAKIDYDREKSLYENNAVAQSDFETCFTAFENARSGVNSALAVFDRAKINLAYATIRAPISGVVISRNVDVGQTVISSFNAPTLFTIAKDLTRMQVYANVDEADIGRIKVGQPAVFTVDAYPGEKFKGVIKQVRLQPNLVQNVVNYTVIMDVPNPDLKLLPGLTANISVKVLEHKGVLRVPSSALRFVPPERYMARTGTYETAAKTNYLNPSTGDSALVWMAKGDSLHASTVVVGLVEGGYSEIKGDIRSGDTLISGVASNHNETRQTKNPFMPSVRPGRRRY